MISAKDRRQAFAFKAWSILAEHGIVYADGTTHKLSPEQMASTAVAYADALIEALDNPKDGVLRYVDQYGEVVATQRVLPKPREGWRIAPNDGSHIITQWDAWLVLETATVGSAKGCAGGAYTLQNEVLFTPDWHNPEGVGSPGDGYRFLVKGEKPRAGDQFCFEELWSTDSYIDESWTYRTDINKPLPPIL